jgi:hypothetical protein
VMDSSGLSVGRSYGPRIIEVSDEVACSNAKEVRWLVIRTMDDE